MEGKWIPPEDVPEPETIDGPDSPHPEPGPKNKSKVQGYKEDIGNIFNNDFNGL